MDNFIVSARKYRPSTFESVVGQKALTQTLKNAIHTNKLAHAYLFCGPRGVGKTSCARIFAKTINCLNPTANGEACNECESCRAFNEQRSYNIHELDAASNNSVEDIRELISQVQIPPQIGRYKVYIVDEVHMLSTAAFNAFLKTLEEPPKHAVFILATTEKHKILPTILSRCQTYDFNRIGIKEIIEHLAYVAKKENISFEPQALNIIARKADGGMRDALSIFDQIVSFCGGNITYQAVIENLNVLDYDYYFRITDAFLQSNVSQALLILNEVINKGFDPQNFITGLSSHFRELLVSKDACTISLIEAAPDVAQRYQQQGAHCAVGFLYQALQISNECDLNYRASRNKRLLVEIALIRIAQLTTAVQQNAMPQAGSQPLKPITPQPVTPTPQPAAPNNATNPVSSVAQPSANYTRQTQPTQKPKEPVIAATIATSLSSNVPVSPNGNASHKATNFGIKNISIHTGIKKEKEEAPVQSGQLPDMNQPVNETQLQKVWTDYTQTIPSEVILVKTLLSCMPHLSGTTIDVIVDNPEQVDKIKERGANLLYFLRAKLQNTHLTMNVRVKEKGERVKIFSAHEKYNYMNEKNPDLTLLKETFGLELA